LTELQVICTLAGGWGKSCDLITLHQSQ